LNSRSKTNSGLLFFFEKITRSHPLLYYVIRGLIRFTNIFEEDAKGVKYLSFKDKINVIDVGASDGIAAKFFISNLNINKVICYEPYKPYVDKIKKIKNNKIIIKPFAIGEKNENLKVYFPRYNFFGKNLDLITYTYYDKKNLHKQIKLDFKFDRNITIVKNVLKISKFTIPKKKIDLIKIDVNGFELSVLKSMIKCIKRDRPVLLLETGNDINKINNLLKKLSYKQYKFDLNLKKFKYIKNGKYPLNTYFIHKQNNISKKLTY
jgi:FkbM family methyltransferase